MKNKTEEKIFVQIEDWLNFFKTDKKWRKNG